MMASKSIEIAILRVIESRITNARTVIAALVPPERGRSLLLLDIQHGRVIQIVATVQIFQDPVFHQRPPVIQPLVAVLLRPHQPVVLGVRQV